MMPSPEFIDKSSTLIASVKGKIGPLDELDDKAIDLAALMLKEAQKIQTIQEKVQQEQLARMMKDPKGKIFTTSMTDQCFRSSNSRRVADQLCYILKTLGIPKYLSWKKRFGLSLFKSFGRLLSPILVPVVKCMVRNETETVILPGEDRPLKIHLAKRCKEGVRVNLNHLGEAVLGEDEAQKRLQVYLEDLANPDIEYISVKISTIFSQINLLAWEHSLNLLAERLSELYSTAQAHHYTMANGASVPKFVNLDMEEYKDLHLTIEVFCKVLSDPQFHSYSAGIVLQAYLPDSFLVQQKLTAWAMERVTQGGAPIKIRIVKGANLAMECVEASLHNWPLACYENKPEVDANFKRMVEYGCLPARARAVHLGIASHNLFDVALALLIRSQNNVEQYVCFEMLEGMADHLRRVVQVAAGGMLLYCPAAKKDEFQNAVAYLVRRLDENTSPNNFLHSLFGLNPGSAEWKHQAALFSHSCKEVENVSALPCRKQNRQEPATHPDLYAAFNNEADTDWSLPQNVYWGKKLIEDWQNPIFSIPLVIAGKKLVKQQAEELESGRDPSNPNLELFKFSLANERDIEAALVSAKKAFPAWGATTVVERSLLLAKVAHALRNQRKALIGAMVANTGKSISEADAEVSEAVDFAEYYRRNIEELYCLEDISWSPKGTVLIAPPWNFPCSIPCGGIIAALATGNCVIFKPAFEAVLVGWLVANIFWEAGVSPEVLQFVSCRDEPIGSSLIKDQRVDLVILTGSTSTAKLFLKMRPNICLIAETGGKNAIIITSLSDRDLAIKTLLQSAFGYSGQKCSACSLAILEAEVYDDPHFRQQLRDAANSLSVGSAWSLHSKVTPLIHAPQPGSPLERSLYQLEPGEEWLLEPKQDPNNPQLWSPGIKMGVKAGSFTHQTELFGPVLGVMRAASLSEAIDLANGTAYGLTAGLQSLDPREHQLWMERIEAGNCYINRGITGAIVQRQPFGGHKESSFGIGFKTGGPNYLVPMMRAVQEKLPKETEPLNPLIEKLSDFAQLHLSEEEKAYWHASIGSYAFYWNSYFSKKHDPSNLLGQDNLLCYQPCKGLLLRLSPHDTVLNLLLSIAAVATVRGRLEISGESAQIDRVQPLIKVAELNLTGIVETEEQLIQRLENQSIQQGRLFSVPSQALQNGLNTNVRSVKISPMLANGRVELLNFLTEINFSIDYHRYGNLGVREDEKRRELKKG